MAIIEVYPQLGIFVDVIRNLLESQRKFNLSWMNLEAEGRGVYINESCKMQRKLRTYE